MHRPGGCTQRRTRSPRTTSPLTRTCPTGSTLSGCQDACLECLHNSLKSIADLEFGQDLRKVVLHRREFDEQFSTDLSVRHSLGEKFQYFEFARGQGGVFVRSSRGR